MTNGVTKKVTLTAKVTVDEDTHFEIEHETGDADIYVRINEGRDTRIIASLPAAQAEMLANALLVVAQKVREEEGTNDRVQ